MSYSSIKFAGMESLISTMTTAGSTLQDQTGTLQTKASGLDVSSPAFAQIIAMGVWAEEQLPGLKRRLALARSMDHAGGKGPAEVSIDESQLSTLTPAQAKAAAAKDAKSLHDHMGDNGGNGSGLDDETADSIYANMNDPYYAAAFAKAYPPAEMAKVLNQLNTQEEGAQTVPDLDDDPAKALDHLHARQKKLLEGLGTTAATASRGTGDLAPPDDYAQQFLDAIGAGDAKTIPAGGPASVNALLKYGSWGTTFSTDFAKGLVKYENTEEFKQREGASGERWFETLSKGQNGQDVHTPDGTSADWDPMTGAMGNLGKDATASQAVLKDPDTVKFLSSRDWITDHGDAYGKAVESATTVNRGQDTAGRTSAAIASTVVASLNADDLREDGQLADMRDSMGRLLGGYIIDVSRLANSGDDDPVPGLYSPPKGHGDNPDIPGAEPPGAAFKLDQLKNVMSATETDHDAFKTVVAASTVLSKTMMDTAGAQAAGKDGAEVAKKLEGGVLPVEMSNAMQNAAKLQGMVIAQGNAGNIDQGKVDDANRATALEFARGVVDLAPIPGGDLVNFAASQGKDALFERFETNKAGEAIDKANNADDANRTMMEQLAVRSLAKNGLLEDTKLSPYAYEKKGSEADFTNPDGSLMSTKDLSENPEKLKAYQAWLRDNRSPLGPVRGPIDAVFDSAYKHWGTS